MCFHSIFFWPISFIFFLPCIYWKKFLTFMILSIYLRALWPSSLCLRSRRKRAVFSSLTIIHGEKILLRSLNILLFLLWGLDLHIDKTYLKIDIGLRLILWQYPYFWFFSWWRNKILILHKDRWLAPFFLPRIILGTIYLIISILSDTILVG